MCGTTVKQPLPLGHGAISDMMCFGILRLIFLWLGL
jgi:hypothetical protein